MTSAILYVVQWFSSMPCAFGALARSMPGLRHGGWSDCYGYDVTLDPKIVQEQVQTDRSRRFKAVNWVLPTSPM